MRQRKKRYAMLGAKPLPSKRNRPKWSLLPTPLRKKARMQLLPHPLASPLRLLQLRLVPREHAQERPPHRLQLHRGLLALLEQG